MVLHRRQVLAVVAALGLGGVVLPPVAVPTPAGAVVSSVVAAAPAAAYVEVTRLDPGQSVSAGGGRFRLTMQGDGNLVLTDNGRPVWGVYTFVPGALLVTQSDGNVVLYDGEGRVLWTTGTNGNPGAALWLQDDGNLVLYRRDGGVLWTRGMPGYRAQTAVRSLDPGQSVRSTNNFFTLLMQTDGNLVLYGPTGPLWASNTFVAGSRLVVQSDGNHVIYDPAGRALWSTASSGRPGATMYLQTDGNLVVYGPGPVWSSSTGRNMVEFPVVGGLEHPWDVGFMADGTMVFTQRPGIVRFRAPDGRLGPEIGVPGVYAVGEAGLMGLAVDPQVPNRIYTCQDAPVGGGQEGQIWGWTVSGLNASRDGAPILAGIPAASYHDGCQLQFGPEGALYVGTGDAARATNPQDPNSLGGKVLRLNRDGTAFAGNPGGYRWVSKGHRNVQGLAVQGTTGAVYSVEHGPGADDEVNLVVPGQNAGWDPRQTPTSTTYYQSVPMTNFTRFPDAVPALWSSGMPTTAPSGGVFVDGPMWARWQGSLMVANLKSTQVLRMRVDGRRLTEVETFWGGVNSGRPRLRAAATDAEGALYLTTDTGNRSDVVYRMLPAL